MTNKTPPNIEEESGFKWNTTPGWFHKAIKDAEPLDCWEAFDEVWKIVRNKNIKALKAQHLITIKEVNKKWEKKTITTPKGKTHPVHDRCEECIEIGKEEGRETTIKECIKAIDKARQGMLELENETQNTKQTILR